MGGLISDVKRWETTGLPQQRRRCIRHSFEPRCLGIDELEQPSFHAWVPEPVYVIGHLGNRLLGGQVAKMNDYLIDQPDLGSIMVRHVSPRVRRSARGLRPAHRAGAKPGG